MTSSQKREMYTHMDVEKLNIFSNVKMSLFNNENIPPLLMDGKDVVPGHRQDDPISGIMFYNNNGDECGGLIYGNEQDGEGNHVSTGASLTFDQYERVQTFC